VHVVQFIQTVLPRRGALKVSRLGKFWTDIEIEEVRDVAAIWKPAEERIANAGSKDDAVEDCRAGSNSGS